MGTGWLPTTLSRPSLHAQSVFAVDAWGQVEVIRRNSDMRRSPADPACGVFDASSVLGRAGLMVFLLLAWASVGHKAASRSRYLGEGSVRDCDPDPDTDFNPDTNPTTLPL